jgi:hypothetical protein
VRGAYAQPGDMVLAFYGEHFGAVQDNNIGLSAQPGNLGSRCAQSGPVVDEGRAAGQRCKKHGLLAASPYDTENEKLHVSIGCGSFEQFMFRPGGFLVPSASGEFLMKNIAFFGVTLWPLADAIDATRKQATLATCPIHLRSYARFGSRRRINHPGE